MGRPAEYPAPIIAAVRVALRQGQKPASIAKVFGMSIQYVCDLRRDRDRRKDAPPPLPKAMRDLKAIDPKGAEPLEELWHLLREADRTLLP